MFICLASNRLVPVVIPKASRVSRNFVEPISLRGIRSTPEVKEQRVVLPEPPQPLNDDSLRETPTPMSWESPHRLQFDNPARADSGSHIFMTIVQIGDTTIREGARAPPFLLIFITTRARTSVNLMPSLRMCVLFNVRQGILRGTEHHQRH